MLTTGSFNCRPIASAISRNGTPSSPAPCSREPAGAASTASRNRRAASSRCTAGQRFDPSPPRAVGVVGVAAVPPGGGGLKCGGGCARAGEADDLMPRRKQLADDGGTDVSGCSGNENSHRKFLH